MNFRKSVASTVAGLAMLGSVAACSSSTPVYDRVYDTHTHQYVVVTDSYYKHHRSLYSGTVTHVKHTTTTVHHSNGTKTVKHTTTHTTTHHKSTVRRSSRRR